MKLARIVNSALTVVAALLLFAHYAMGPTILANVLVLLLSGLLCLANVAVSLALLPGSRHKLLPLGNLVVVASILVVIVRLFYADNVPAGYGP